MSARLLPVLREIQNFTKRNVTPGLPVGAPAVETAAKKPLRKGRR